MNWEDHVYYDESSLTCLRWKHSVYINTYCLVSKNSPAGSKQYVRGYFSITCSGVKQGVHRVVWMLHNGLLDENDVVDHIDGDPSNNTIANLRLVSVAENQRNVKKSSRNKSGTTGVCYTHGTYNGNKYFYWKATWYDIDGKQKAKVFSESKYGYDEAKQLAISFRESKINELNACGFGYTERHGV